MASEDNQQSQSTGTSSHDHDTGKSEWLKDHLKVIETNIWKKANDIAKDEERTMEPRDVAQAAASYAPGKELPPTEKRRARDVMYEKLALSISGVTLLSALLALAFGLIAWRAAANNSSSEVAKGAWDIVKIFAGAIVGSAGTTMATGLKRNQGQ